MRPIRIRLILILIALCGLPALDNVLPLQIGFVSTGFAQTAKDIKRMERLVSRTERRLGSVEKDIERLSDRNARQAESMIERIAKKIADIEADLADVPDTIDGATEAKAQITALKATFDAASAAAMAGSSTNADTNTGDPALDRHIKTALSKADRAVSNAEKAVEDLSNADERAAERLLDRADDKLTKAQESVDELANLSEDVAGPLNVRLDDIGDRFSTLKDAIEANQANAEENEAYAAALQASGEMNQLREEVENLSALATSLRTMQLEPIVFQAEERVQRILDDVAAWPVQLEKFERFQQEQMPKLAGTTAGRVVVTLASTLGGKIADANNRLAGLSEEIAETTESNIAGMITLAEEAQEFDRFPVFGSRLNRSTRTIEGEQIGITNLMRVYKTVPGAEPHVLAKLEENFAEANAKVEGIRETFREQIIDGNPAPYDLYRENDRDALLALAEEGWRTIHGQAAIAEIRIPSAEWARTTGERWSAANQLWQKVDFSTLNAIVIEAPIDGVATTWIVELQKRHLEQDAVISNPLSRHRHEPQPQQQIRAEKL